MKSFDNVSVNHITSTKKEKCHCNGYLSKHANE